jgi:4-amino-4-deoxy-L-arabinose transferase-like glycosyltransferase
MAKNVSREAALGLGLGSAALVWTVYNGICPSVSDTKASAPQDSILTGSERTAAFISAGLVGGIALIAKDPTVFVIGGVALLALSWAHRHANVFDPMAPGNGMLPSPSNLQEAAESPGYVPA